MRRCHGRRKGHEEGIRKTKLKREEEKDTTMSGDKRHEAVK